MNVGRSVDEFFRQLAKDDKEFAILVEQAEKELQKEIDDRLLVDDDFRKLYESEQKRMYGK